MLKTKLFAVGLSILCLMSFMLSGCNKAAGKPAAESTTVTETTAETTTEAKKEGFVFEHNGISLELDMPAKEFVDKSGLSFSYRETNGACFGGDLSGYYSDDVVVITNKSGIITEIQIVGDRFKTKEGITVGSTVEQLKAAYGEPKDQTEETCNYVRGSSYLAFIIEGGKIASILCAHPA